MAIQTVQNLIDTLNEVENKNLQPFIYCAADAEFISIDKIAIEEEIGVNKETRLVLWEAD